MRNDIECKYMFVFPLNNSTCKWLTNILHTAWLPLHDLCSIEVGRSQTHPFLCYQWDHLLTTITVYVDLCETLRLFLTDPQSPATIMVSQGSVPTEWIRFKCGLHNSLILTTNYTLAWRRHQMETFSTLLALCEGNSPSEFPSQRPVT